MKKSVSIITSVLITVLAALLIVSVSISLPILIRPFYYAQIEHLDLPPSLSYEQIKRCYDEMMDYCLGLSSEFSAGGLKFSEEGVSHFDDVRVLFFVDFAVIIASALLLAAIFITLKLTKVKPHRFFGRSAPFWSVVSIGSICSAIGIACAVNFRQTFIFFHKIFFVGKENWAFDPSTDPIILLLPNQFFSNCGLLIFASVIIFSIAIMLYEFIPRKKLKK